MKNIGYCCIPIGCNEGLKKKEHITVNRGMVRRTFDAKGLPYVSELIIENLKDTLKVLDYNLKNHIYIYRLSSDSFPWMSEYEFSDLPNFKLIQVLMTQIGEKIKSNSIRCSYHPGPFNVISSQNDLVVETAEKNPISNNAIAGFYYFKKSSFFIDSAYKVILDNASFDNKFFTSSVFNQMILDNYKIGYYLIPTNTYFSFYTPDKIKEFEFFLNQRL